MSHPPPPATNVFDAAKAIVETLKQLDKQQQEQAIRFASESLGLGTSSHSQPPAGSSLSAPGTTPISSGSQIHSTDIKQFTESKAPKSDQQFAAVATYFYQFEAPEGQRKDAIDLEDLKTAARQAKRKIPGQFALNNAKNSGYLDSAGRGKFKLSTVGENLVAITLPGNNSEASTRRGGGRNRVTKKKAAKKTRSKKRAKRGR